MYDWGLDQSGANRGHRVIQKRGKIIKGDDFTVLKDTYPVHSLSQEPRRHINRQDLLMKRKQQNLTELDIANKAWDTANPRVETMKDYVNSETYVSKPRYSSLEVKKTEDKKIARAKVGLIEHF